MSVGHDGQIIAWDLAQQKALWNVPKAHVGAVNGIIYTHDGSKFVCTDSPKHQPLTNTAFQLSYVRFLSCGHDKTVKLFESVTSVPEDPEAEEAILSAGRYLPVVSPVKSFVGKHSFLDIDRNWGAPGFATCGVQVSAHVTSISSLLRAQCTYLPMCVRSMCGTLPDRLLFTILLGGQSLLNPFGSTLSRRISSHLAGQITPSYCTMSGWHHQHKRLS